MEHAWTDWIGRSETLHDTVDARPVRALAATLDREPPDLSPGGVVPHLWLWLFFTPVAPMREVGPDGHPKRGGFLPPIPAPRRMWAGSRCECHAPLRTGAALTRTSTIASIAEKEGRAGPLTFVTVRHETQADGEPVFSEEQDLVYMPIPERFAPPPPVAAPAPEFGAPVAVDPVLLFRFSALTFNGHRIHYDRAYATDVEKYPGLVVHGPLQAILMFNLGLDQAAGRTPARFAFRGLRPLFDFDAVTVGGRATGDGGFELFTANADGATGARAEMTFRD